MLFKVYAEALTRFIRNYHLDMLGSEEWGNGDSTNISAGEFYRVAKSIWGLDSPGNIPSEYRGKYFVAYNQSDGYFLFEIKNIESLRRIGLAGFGEIIDK